MEKPFKTGAFKSKKDKRDIKDPHLALATPYPDEFTTDFPGFTGFDASLLDARYQRQIGACVLCTIATHVEYLYWKKTGIYKKLSVAFLTCIVKRFIDQNSDEGTAIRSALKAVMKYGICTEDTMPTNYSLTWEEFINQPIPEKAWTEALDYTIGGYIYVPVDRSLIAAAIYKYGLVAVRMECGDTWWIPSWNPKDIFPLRKPKTIVSGHAVSEYRYMLADKTNLKFLNWWSKRWGENGRGEHVLEDYEPTEAWVLTLDSVMHLQSDLTVSVSLIKKIMNFLRSIGTLKSYIKEK